MKVDGDKVKVFTKRKSVGLLISILLCMASFLTLLIPPVGAPISPSFTIYLGCPNSSPRRIYTTDMVTNEMQRIGIDAHTAASDWGVWTPRIFDPEPSILGASYVEGGWDTFVIGWSPGVTLDTELFFHSQSFVPDGYNYVLWNDATNDALIDAINAEWNDTQRIQLLRQWQRHFYTESPKAIIFYPMSAWVYDPELVGFENVSYLYPQMGDPGFRWSATSTQSTFVQTFWGFADDFNPLLFDDYQEQVPCGPVYESLFYYNSSQDLFAWNQTPALAATPYTVSADGCNWTIHLRDDVFWPTGWPFNASDLYFSYQALCTANTTAPAYNDFLMAGLVEDDGDGLNTSLVTIVNEFQLNVTFPKPYGWAKFLLNVAPVSWAALKDVPFEDWEDHPSNTGEEWTTLSGPDSPSGQGHTITIHGPLGLGPYDCLQSGTGWNATAETMTVKLRPAPGVTTGTDPGYYLGHKGHHLSLPDLFPTIKTLGGIGWSNLIGALENGTIDFIDSDFGIEQEVIDESIDPTWGEVLMHVELEVQEMGFNMQHPILGTGLATPLGQNDSSRAAEAARYVRQAINHLIPREEIINEVEDGFGYPGITFVSPLLEAADPSLQPYEYNLTKAKALLEMAGYEFVPLPDLLLHWLPIIGAIFGVEVIILAVVVWRYRNRIMKRFERRENWRDKQ